MGHLRQNLTTTECKGVYQALVSTMDWIGTTETLSTSTVPLLEQVLGRPFSDPNKVSNKVEKKLFRVDSLSPSGQQSLHDRMAWDHEMYNKVLQHFPPFTLDGQ